ncbi:DinB family protein [Streptomyces sp. SID13726]|uniref:DinB family protein n=1 Tax=Streptomyces sp. SID13726 TaxID=2706058 RepID=UPI0013BB9BE8|nr:DinB family protein [Streptomyces sp. SID13726]NEA99853.1 DinB family protein [Streptomyces sp. SID13726]
MTQEIEEIPLEPPVAGSEVDTLIGSLERSRRLFGWKTGGLDAAGLNQRLAPSAMTLGGLLKHLALVEDEYLTRRLLGTALGPPWDAVDWDSEPDWEWRSAASDSPEEVYGLWAAAVSRSRVNLRQVLSEGGVDQPVRLDWPDGRGPSVRRVLIDLIEEYARHLGQADLIRESIDGLVGEDPPAS